MIARSLVEAIGSSSDTVRPRLRADKHQSK